LRAEDGEDYEHIVNGLVDFYQPVGFMENFWVAKIAVEMLRSARLLGHEQHILAYRNFEPRLVQSILRFQATNNHQLAQAMEKLESLQSRRIAKSKQHPSSDGDVTNLVSGQSEMAKRLENDDQSQAGHEVPSSEVCGTNPNPADSLDNEGERKEDRDAQG
jgi:hypothetical protein